MQHPVPCSTLERKDHISNCCCILSQQRGKVHFLRSLSYTDLLNRPPSSPGSTARFAQERGGEWTHEAIDKVQKEDLPFSHVQILMRYDL